MKNNCIRIEYNTTSIKQIQMDYTVHGILQARILEWVAFPNPGIEPRSPALQVDSLPAEPQGKFKIKYMMFYLRIYPFGENHNVKQNDEEHKI